MLEGHVDRARVASLLASSSSRRSLREASASTDAAAAAAEEIGPLLLLPSTEVDDEVLREAFQVMRGTLHATSVPFDHFQTVEEVQAAYATRQRLARAAAARLGVDEADPAASTTEVAAMPVPSAPRVYLNVFHPSAFALRRDVVLAARRTDVLTAAARGGVGREGSSPLLSTNPSLAGSSGRRVRDKARAVGMLLQGRTAGSLRASSTSVASPEQRGGLPVAPPMTSDGQLAASMPFHAASDGGLLAAVHPIVRQELRREAGLAPANSALCTDTPVLAREAVVLAPLRLVGGMLFSEETGQFLFSDMPFVFARTKRQRCLLMDVDAAVAEATAVQVLKTQVALAGVPTLLGGGAGSDDEEFTTHTNALTKGDTGKEPKLPVGGKDHRRSTASPVKLLATSGSNSPARRRSRQPSTSPHRDLSISPPLTPGRSARRGTATPEAAAALGLSNTPPFTSRTPRPSQSLLSASELQVGSSAMTPRPSRVGLFGVPADLPHGGSAPAAGRRRGTNRPIDLPQHASALPTYKYANTVVTSLDGALPGGAVPPITANRRRDGGKARQEQAALWLAAQRKEEKAWNEALPAHLKPQRRAPPPPRTVLAAHLHRTPAPLGPVPPVTGAGGAYHPNDALFIEIPTVPEQKGAPLQAAPPPSLRRRTEAGRRESVAPLVSRSRDTEPSWGLDVPPPGMTTASSAAFSPQETRTRIDARVVFTIDEYESTTSQWVVQVMRLLRREPALGRPPSDGELEWFGPVLTRAVLPTSATSATAGPPSGGDQFIPPALRQRSVSGIDGGAGASTTVSYASRRRASSIAVAPVRPVSGRNALPGEERLRHTNTALYLWCLRRDPKELSAGITVVKELLRYYKHSFLVVRTIRRLMRSIRCLQRFVRRMMAARNAALARMLSEWSHEETMCRRRLEQATAALPNATTVMRRAEVAAQQQKGKGGAGAAAVLGGMGHTTTAPHRPPVAPAHGPRSAALGPKHGAPAQRPGPADHGSPPVDVLSALSDRDFTRFGGVDPVEAVVRDVLVARLLTPTNWKEATIRRLWQRRREHIYRLTMADKEKAAQQTSGGQSGNGQSGGVGSGDRTGSDASSDDEQADEYLTALPVAREMIPFYTLEREVGDVMAQSAEQAQVAAAAERRVAALARRIGDFTVLAMGPSAARDATVYNPDKKNRDGSANSSRSFSWYIPVRELMAETLRTVTIELSSEKSAATAISGQRPTSGGGLVPLPPAAARGAFTWSLMQHPVVKRLISDAPV